MSKVSSKNQITLPVEILREAGISQGDELRIRVTGPGRMELERPEDFITRWSGALSGAHPPGYLDELRDEWER